MKTRLLTAMFVCAVACTAATNAHATDLLVYNNNDNGARHITADSME